jgi:hypothetical protein
LWTPRGAWTIEGMRRAGGKGIVIASGVLCLAVCLAAGFGFRSLILERYYLSG